MDVESWRLRGEGWVRWKITEGFKKVEGKLTRIFQGLKNVKVEN
jgi:hypothetical protein